MHILAKHRLLIWDLTVHSCQLKIQTGKRMYFFSNLLDNAGAIINLNALSN